MPPAGLDQVLAFFYRPQGRIGRAEYALGLAFIYAVNLALLSIFFFRAPEAGGLIPAMLLALPLLLGFFVIVVKRCHDLGLPGSFVVLLFVPVVGVVWMIALLFIPGSQGPNLYGAQPSFRPD